MQEILETFATQVREKFSMPFAGAPEDQLRAPFENLLRGIGESLGRSVVPIGETTLADHIGRPDYGIAVAGLLAGHVELKAPGKGARPDSFRGHDRSQWQRFKCLPNILYSDGEEWGLFRTGEEIRLVRLEGDPSRLGISSLSATTTTALANLFADFLSWKPLIPTTAKQLAMYLAPLCRMLKEDVLDALRRSAPGIQSVARDWRNYLFPDADDQRFADSYAQTVTFALLLARSNGADSLVTDEAVASLSGKNSLLGRALQVLTDDEVEQEVSASLSMLKRVIEAVPSAAMERGVRDPWLHFYEDFLQEYDPKLRRAVGAYYTPLQVVHAQVRLVSDILRNRMGKPMGFAEGGVTTLDPAVGTGTYLLAIIEEAMPRVIAEEGKGAGRARASLLAQNLFGFEIMVGPYAVAALRMTRMLQSLGAGIPQDGVQVFLNNTLESPHEIIPELPMMYRVIGKEHQRAKRVKESVPVYVCMGNPPYGRHEAATKDNKMATGGWVRWGEAKDGKDAIFKDFVVPVSEEGEGRDLKNLYNLYTYFWRWGLWKVFEQGLAHAGGIVAFITASSFIEGDAFMGMRKILRQVCDEIWIIDLGGDSRGSTPEENVFAIQTPVAITIAVRYGAAQPLKPAEVWYSRIYGSRVEKLAALDQIDAISDVMFQRCASEWLAPMKVNDRSADYFSWPKISDLIPWQHSGVQFKRSWPIAPSTAVLEKRWVALLNSTDRARDFRETDARTVDTLLTSTTDPLIKLDSIANLASTALPPEVVRYSYRAFDRQWIFLDQRLSDRLRPVLWSVLGPKQIFFTSVSSTTVGVGPALMASSYVPDLHQFRGSYGAKDVFPLYRDANASIPNIHPDLLTAISELLDFTPSVEQFACYVFGILGFPGFQAEFASELESRELRIPISLNADTFEKVVALGEKGLFFSLLGERFKNPERPRLSGIARCTVEIVEGAPIENFGFDAVRSAITVGTGEVSPVSPNIWNYQVSGYPVVQSWLANRMAKRPGKKSSLLDLIGVDTWTSELTTELLKVLWSLEGLLSLEKEHSRLLLEVIQGPLLQGADLSRPDPPYKRAPRDTFEQHELL